jgi:hypothetical protein
MRPSLYTPFLIAHTEVPATAFAPSVRINWFSPGVDQSAPAAATHFKAPTAWVQTSGQPILRLSQLQQAAAACQKPKLWLYGETPDLIRLIGNAVPGFGA